MGIAAMRVKETVRERWHIFGACIYNARLAANVAQSVEQLIRNQ